MRILDIKGIMKGLKKAIKDGLFHILVGNTLIKCISFVSSISIVRIVDKAQYGYLAYVDNLYNYVLLFAGLGMSTAMLKFCSPDDTPESNKYFITFSLKYGVMIQLGITCVMLCYVQIVGVLFVGAKPILYASVLYPTVYYVLTTIQSVARAYRENRLYVKIALIQSIVVFVCSVVGTILIGIMGVVVARYLSMIIAIGFGISFLLDKTHHVNTVIQSNKQRLAFIKMSVAMMLTNMFSSIIPINEMFIINALIKDELITASYKAAVLIPSQILVVTNSIIVYAFPIIASKNNTKRESYVLTKKASWLNLALVLIVTTIGIVLNPWLIRTIYGDIYTNSILLSNIFWVIYAINAGLRMIPLNMLPAIGKTKFCAVASILTCVFHAVLDYFLIANYGVSGAAYAAGIVYMLSAVSYWLYMRFVCKKEGDKTNEDIS